MLPQEKFEIYDYWDCPHIRQKEVFFFTSNIMIIGNFLGGGSGEPVIGISPGSPPKQMTVKEEHTIVSNDEIITLADTLLPSSIAW